MKRALQKRFEERWRLWIERPPFFLTPISWIYGVLVWFRNHFYDWGVLSIHKVDKPVISVGNLTLGGTGKTPLVMELARLLPGPIAIVTRGYGGGVEGGKAPCLLSEGQGPLHSWEFCGDEAFLLASSLPGVTVVAGRDRVAGAKLAIEKGAEVIILDDGMQHRRLHRDMEIVLIDGRKSLDRARLFPRGELREPISSLRRADLTLATYCDESPIGIPLPARYEGEGIAGRRLALFCAIGHPEGFLRTVQKMGGEVILHHFFADHALVEEELLQTFAARAAALGAEALVCTAKDRVKLPISLQLPLPVRVVDLSFSLSEEIVAQISARTLG